jgi:hypothetical protein
VTFIESAMLQPPTHLTLSKEPSSFQVGVTRPAGASVSLKSDFIVPCGTNSFAKSAGQHVASVLADSWQLSGFQRTYFASIDRIRYGRCHPLGVGFDQEDAVYSIDQYTQSQHTI